MSFRLRPFSFLGGYPTTDIEIGTDMFLRSGQTFFCCTKKTGSSKEPTSLRSSSTNGLSKKSASCLLFISAMAKPHQSGSITYRSFAILTSPPPDAVLEDGSLLRELLDAAATEDYFMVGNHGMQATRLDEYRTFDLDDRRLAQTSKFWHPQ